MAAKSNNHRCLFQNPRLKFDSTVYSRPTTVRDTNGKPRENVSGELVDFGHNRMSSIPWLHLSYFTLHRRSAGLPQQLTDSERVDACLRRSKRSHGECELH